MKSLDSQIFKVVKVAYKYELRNRDPDLLLEFHCRPN